MCQFITPIHWSQSREFPEVWKPEQQNSLQSTIRELPKKQFENSFLKLVLPGIGPGS